MRRRTRARNISSTARRTRQVLVQGTVERGGQRALFDDVIGLGFALIGAREDPEASLDGAQRAFLEEIGAHVVWVSDEPTSRSGRSLDDTEGAYDEWFAVNGCEAVLVRPDGYIYGTAATSSDLPALLDGLRRALKLTREPAAEAVPPS